MHKAMRNAVIFNKKNNYQLHNGDCSTAFVCILRMHRRTRNRTGVNCSTGTAHAFRRTDCGDDDKTFGSRNKRSGGGYRG